MRNTYGTITHTIQYIMTGYADIVLGVIPVALFGIAAALLAAGLPLTTAVPVGAVVAVGVMGHAMFVRSPTRPRLETQSTDVSPTRRVMDAD